MTHHMDPLVRRHEEGGGGGNLIPRAFPLAWIGGFRIPDFSRVDAWFLDVAESIEPFSQKGDHVKFARLKKQKHNFLFLFV